MELTYPPYTAPIFPSPNVNSPSQEIPASVEMLPLIEDCGLVVGRMTRKYAHSGSMALHPVVHLHLINRRGQIYLQKRSMKKDLLPGYWDTAVGGHVSYGEQISEALYREASEELSLMEFNPTPITTYVFQSASEKEMVNVFACISDTDPQPDHDEVTEGKWWDSEEILSSMGKEILTPNFEGEYAKIHAKLEALL